MAIENTPDPEQKAQGSESNPGSVFEEVKKMMEDATSPSAQSMLDVVMSQTLGLMMHNQVSTQQNAQILNTAVLSSVISRILSSGPDTESPRPVNKPPAPAKPEKPAEAPAKAANKPQPKP